MLSSEVILDRFPGRPGYSSLGLDRLALIPIIVGLLASASILLVIYQDLRADQFGFEATEVWSAYQMNIVKTAVEQDPNLKAQYIEEQDVLRQDAQNLRGKSSDARHAVAMSGYAALLLLLGAATAVIALITKSTHSSYAGVLLAVIGVGLGIRALF
jgi:hypothetical protein